VPSRTPAGNLPTPRRLSAWAAYGTLLAIYLLVFGQSLAGQVMMMLSQGDAAVTAPAPDALWPAALATWARHALLVLLACAALWITARACRVGIREVFAPAPLGRRRQAWAVFAWTLTAYAVCMTGQSLLKGLLGAGDGGFQMETPGEMLRMAAMIGPTQITTGFVEETVVVGCLVLLLAAAHRPAWEVGAVAAIAKTAYHAYYGWPVLALVPAALIAVWLYRRTGRLWPIVLGHAAYNALFTCLVVATALTTP